MGRTQMKDFENRVFRGNLHLRQNIHVNTQFDRHQSHGQAAIRGRSKAVLDTVSRNTLSRLNEAVCCLCSIVGNKNRRLTSFFLFFTAGPATK
jgi:hypothetical protein